MGDTGSAADGDLRNGVLYYVGISRTIQHTAKDSGQKIGVL
jgi:hypothetical protein